MPLLQPRRRPQSFDYVSDRIQSQARTIPGLYALKDRKEQQARTEALNERGLVQTEELATLGRESGERIAASRRELDTSLAEATRRSNEAIAERQNMLTEAGQSQTKRQNKYGNIIAGAGLGLSAVGLASDAGWLGSAGNLVSEILGL